MLKTTFLFLQARRKILFYIVTTVIFFILFRNILIDFSEIKSLKINFFNLDFNLMLAFLFSIYIVNVYSWHILLKIYGLKISFLENLKIWMLSNVSRFLPGSFWQYPGRVIFLSDLGFSKAVGISAVVFETIITLSSGFAFVVSYYLMKQFSEQIVNSSKSLILVLVLTLILLIVGLEVLKNTLKILIRFTNLNISLPKMDIHGSLKLSTLFLLRFISVGGFLFYLIKVFSPLSHVLFVDVVNIYATSWIIGFISIFAPGGIGVTEASISWQLSSQISGSLASLIAISFRLGLFVAEALFLIYILFYLKFKKRKV